MISLLTLLILSYSLLIRRAYMKKQLGFPLEWMRKKIISPICNFKKYISSFILWSVFCGFREAHWDRQAPGPVLLLEIGLPAAISAHPPQPPFTFVVKPTGVSLILLQ